MITEYLVSKALDKAFRTAKALTGKVLDEKKVKLLTTRGQIEQSLNIHLTSIRNWSDEVSFSDLKSSKLTSEIFIELDLFLYPRRIRINAQENIKSIPLSKIFDEGASHFILLGQPGAGKTTSMKYLCQQIFQNGSFYPDRFSLPLLVKFRELNNEQQGESSSPLFDGLFRILGLDLQFPSHLAGGTDDMATERANLRRKLVLTWLESLNVLLVLDGFDELGSESSRTKCIAEIRALVQNLNRSTVILTSRTGDFRYNIQNAEEYELCSLNKAQVKQFSLRWLGDSKKAETFLKKVYQTPFADTAIRPLTLAHLCAIYERIEDIPEKPKTIYKKIINLLLEEWDLQRTIKRQSKYAVFEIDRKYELLCHLAYELTVTLATSVFTSANLIYIYGRICNQYGLESNEAKEVAAELETHNGLFLQTGYEQFEFAHKSLQEFLTAEYLVKLPSIPDWVMLGRLPNESAIAVSISSNPGAYCAELVFRRFRNRMSEHFVRAFLSRLIIEKPDLGSEPSLQLALLLLVSEYLDLSFIEKGRPWDYQSDQFMLELENLVKRSHTSTLTDILDCYATNRIYETRNPDLIHKLTLHRKALPIPLQPMFALFPKDLFLRTSLLQFRSKPKRVSKAKI